ncbi:MAG: hypothetical protein RL662_69 [Bacteroidota bacterium]|jgi:hypothetical protein
MKKKLNDAIIEAIKSRLPQEKQIVNYLMGVLHLGKESVYRRIRGDVVFTFDEIAALSTQLGFSIDNLVGLKGSERVLFSANLHRNYSLEDIYYNKLLKYVAYEVNDTACDYVINRIAINYIPYGSSLYLNLLTKFRYYKWMHQTRGIEANTAMSDLAVPKKISDFQKKWIAISDKKRIKVIYIIDRNIFPYMCNDINYFYSRNLINTLEVEQLKNELMSLIQHWENMTRTGLSGTGIQMQFYLLDFNLNTTCSHSDYDNNSMSNIHTESIISLQSDNEHVCEVQKSGLICSSVILFLSQRVAKCSE